MLTICVEFEVRLGSGKLIQLVFVFRLTMATNWKTGCFWCTL